MFQKQIVLGLGLRQSSDPLAHQTMKQSAYFGAIGAAHSLFDWPPLPTQGASAMHEVANHACWHSEPSLTNSRNSVSVTNRANLSVNPHCLVMASKGPANSLSNWRQGA